MMANGIMNTVFLPRVALGNKSASQSVPLLTMPNTLFSFVDAGTSTPTLPSGGSFEGL